MLPAQPNQSLIDGLAVLQAVAVSVDPAGSRDVARRLNLEPTRVNRLLKTLAALGLTEQTSDRKYRSGSGLHVLAATALFGSRLLARATGPICELRLAAPGLTVALGVRWQREVAYLFHLSPNRPLAEGIGRTALFPAERSSIGQVLLAGLPEAEIRALYCDDSRSKQNKRLAALRRCHRKGFALVEGDSERTLAVPVGTADTAHAALAFAGSFPDASIGCLLGLLRQAADDIHAQEISQ